ncbi:macrophage mannose receptor 1-like protein, partial [Aphelenchoides avenae]
VTRSLHGLTPRHGVARTELGSNSQRTPSTTRIWPKLERQCASKRIRNDVLVDLSTFSPFWGNRMWLGASINITSTKWTWLDGSPLSYKTWAKGYPTKSSGSESCLYMDYTDGKWYNDDCYADACFLCQYPAQGAEKKRCLAGLLPGTDGCYSFSSMSSEGYAAAQLHCGALGGALPIVKSAEDNVALVNLTRSVCTQDQSLWLGADKRQSTSWTWNDGSPLTFTNWADG